MLIKSNESTTLFQFYMSYNDASYLLLGSPVEQSLSPLIHNTAFRCLGLPSRYAAQEIAKSQVATSIKHIDGEHIFGANVTIPYKQAVLPYLDGISPVAKRVGAVNTIYFANGRKMGHNTDVEGFLKPLSALGLQPKHVVILGSGGAARAVMVAAEEGLKASRISVVSRNLLSARAACHDLQIGEAWDFSSLDQLIPDASLIVNATPVGMWPKIDTSPIPDSITFLPSQTIYDLVYNPEETRLLQAARVQGARTLGGLSMLIAQAAASFKIWTGLEMPVDAVEMALKTHLDLT